MMYQNNQYRDVCQSLVKWRRGPPQQWARHQRARPVASRDQTVHYDAATKMWWRFLAFCVLVSLVLFIVLSCINGRPVVHLFFHRCCGEDIENDQVIFENFGDNFLRERLVGAELEAENATISLESLEKAIDGIGELMNVHNPSTRDSYEDLVEELNLDNTDEVIESTTQVMPRVV